MQSNEKNEKEIDPTEFLAIWGRHGFNEYNEETNFGFRVNVKKLTKWKPLIEYQSKEIKEKVLKHRKKFEKLQIVNRGLLFKLEEVDEMLEAGEKLRSEGFKLTLDVELMRLGSPIAGGYLYAYDMNRRSKLLELAERLKREIRILPGEPLETDEIENLFLDCLAVDLHYDYHAIWLWLRFPKLREKYELLAPPDLVKYVCDAELVYLKDLIEKLGKNNEKDKNNQREG